MAALASARPWLRYWASGWKAVLCASTGVSGAASASCSGPACRWSGAAWATVSRWAEALPVWSAR